ncbi:leucine-rich repeat protein (LRRP) [Trypanosoma brucei equiperdum]|uniref:Leucine-rich repeat protein (LRRP) n=1 Tax=Trypanosoma brucei equiperdum TaxID=630700 RepID=A0A3L6LII5_9TRYP|nr:leucine-rich repeat protein (LRRP) [Trypanosoma brucei equiperdum]
MGGVVGKIPVLLRGGKTVDGLNFHGMVPTDTEELTELLTVLNCRGYDTKVEVHPLPAGFPHTGEVCSTYELVLRGIVLERGDLEFIGSYASLNKLHFIECSGSCDLGMLSGHSFLSELRVDVDGEVSHYKALQELPSLRTLWLRNSNMTLTDFFHVGEVDTLESLTLRGALNFKCLEAVARLPRLRALDLSETLVNDKCLHAISACKTLQQLGLSSCKRLRDVSPLTQIASLEELNLSRCENLKEVGALYRLSRLFRLDLRGVHLTYRVVYSLSKCTGLTELYVSSCEGLSGVAWLSNLESLGDLDIQWRKNLKHTGDVLACLPLLRVLDLSGTSISNESLWNISESKLLRRLDLSFCGGVKDISPISDIVTLEELNLKGCTSITEGVDKLGNLVNLHLLNMSNTPLQSGFLYNISSIESLVELDLSSCWGVASLDSSVQTAVRKRKGSYPLARHIEGVNALGRLPKLRLLNMSSTPVTDECLHGLQMCKSLVWLNLSLCANLTDVSPLSSVKTLEEVDLGCCGNLKWGAGSLRRLPQLRILDLKNTVVTDHCLGDVAYGGGVVNRMLGWCGMADLSFSRWSIRRGGNLVRLDLSSCWGLTDIAHLTSITTLEELRFTGCRNLKDGVDALGQLPVLHLLDLSGTSITDDSLQGLSACRSLVTLNISSCANLTDVSPLSRISSLEELNLQKSKHIRRGIDELVSLPRLYLVYLCRADFSRGVAEELEKRGIVVKQM